MRWNNCKSVCVLCAHCCCYSIPAAAQLWRCTLGKVQNLFLLTEKSFRQDPWKHSLLRAILHCFLHIAKAFSSDPVKDLSTCVPSADSLFKTKETGDVKVTDGSWACPFSWTRISFFKEYSHTRYYNYKKIRAKKVVEIICIYVSFLFWSCLSCNIASHYQRRK